MPCGSPVAAHTVDFNNPLDAIDMDANDPKGDLYEYISGVSLGSVPAVTHFFKFIEFFL